MYHHCHKSGLMSLGLGPAEYLIQISTTLSSLHVPAEDVTGGRLCLPDRRCLLFPLTGKILKDLESSYAHITYYRSLRHVRECLTLGIHLLSCRSGLPEVQLHCESNSFFFWSVVWFDTSGSGGYEQSNEEYRTYKNHNVPHSGFSERS